MSSEVPKSLHLNALNDCCAYHEQSGICPFLRARVTQIFGLTRTRSAAVGKTQDPAGLSLWIIFRLIFPSTTTRLTTGVSPVPP
jgi:hypothetical protein